MRLVLVQLQSELTLTAVSVTYISSVSYRASMDGLISSTSIDFENNCFSRLSSVTAFHIKSQAGVTGCVSLTSRSNSSSILDGRARLSLPIPLQSNGKSLTPCRATWNNTQGWFIDVSTEERHVGNEVEIRHTLRIRVR